MSMSTRANLFDLIGEKVLIFDGAMGTQIQLANLKPDDFTLNDLSHFSKSIRNTAQKLDGKILDGCNEILNLTRPDIIEKIHCNYLEAGSDLIETNTFGSTGIVLAEYEIEGLEYDISLAAAQIARKAADQYSTPEKPRYVVGALGPGTKLATLGQASWDALISTYTKSFIGLLEGGADGLLLETLQDLLMVKAGVVSAINAMSETKRKVPLIVQVTMEQMGTMLVGSDLAAAVNMLEMFPEVSAIGMNCATGPEEMIPHLKFLCQNSTRPLSIQPNAGLPVMEKGQAIYKLTPDQFADYHERFVEEFGVAITGGCCGTTPAHIQAVAEKLKDKKPSPNSHWGQVRMFFPKLDFQLDKPEKAEQKKLIGCSSLYQFIPYKQENSFLIVGEKTNANGSKAFRNLLAAENWEALTDLARELESEGSQVLDVCAAYVGRDEIYDMQELLQRYNRHITVPIMIDSTEVPVIEASLKCLAGKPIVNSINFEDGGDRLHKVLALCKKYGAAVVALTIDEDGMAKTVSKKIQIASRIIEQTRAYGLADHDVFVDCLTFTLGSGDEEFRKAGEETILAIQELKSLYPNLNTVLGISNISFGLNPAIRQVLNSVFLRKCLDAGLTSAIVHYSKLVSEHKIEPDVWGIAEDLVYDRRRFQPSEILTP
jgi:5-methyltetrahydrofolate--homocysteine methyltransferase